MKHSKIDKSESEKIRFLYEKYKKIMYRSAKYILKDSELAEDAVHQTFLRVVNNLHKIDIENDVKTKNFLVIICKNVAINMYNKNSEINDNITYLDFDSDKKNDIEFVKTPKLEPCNVLITKENVTTIVKAIEELPEIYRDVIILERFYGYSLKEISELLKIPYGTIKKRSERAREKLKDSLKKEV